MQISRIGPLQSRLAKSKDGLVNKGMYSHLSFFKIVPVCVGGEQVR